MPDSSGGTERGPRFANGRPGADEPAAPRYEIRVRGHLGARWACWFDGLDLAAEDDGPARWVIVAAKTVTATTAGLAFGTAGMITGFAGAAVGGTPLGTGSAHTSRALWAVLYIALAALIGLGVGIIARHTAGAITRLLLWSFVIESLFAPAMPEGVRHFLPFSAGHRLLDAGPNFEPPVAIADLLARPQYALIFDGYALVSLAIGTLLLYRRGSN